MEQALELCLVSPPRRANSMFVPTALLYLQAWMTKVGVSSTIVDEKCDPTTPDAAIPVAEITDRIVARLRALKPRFVGISCFTSEYWEVLELATRIRAEVDCHIVIGGPHPCLMPEDFFFEGSPVKYAVSGDGMEPLASIVLQHRAGATRATGVGIAHDLPSSADAVARPADFTRWEELPLPDYGQLDMEHYARPSDALLRQVILSGVHVFTTIGCPYRCTFCACSARKVRYRPMEHVLDEISMLRDRYAIDGFYVQDDTFLIKKGRIQELVAGLQARKLDLVWGMETRANLLTDEIAALVARNGCLQIDFGVESGSPEALKRMKKGVTREQIVRAFDICHKYGLRTWANFMFNTPGETHSDVDDTFELAARIKATRAVVALTLPYPGTEIYRTYVQPPLSKDEYRLLSDRGDQIAAVVGGRFTMAEHSRDLLALCRMFGTRFNGLRAFFDYTASPVYWRKVATSKRRLQYIEAMATNPLAHARRKALRLYNAVKLRRQHAAAPAPA